MPQPYSQFTAFWTITKSSFKAIFANFTALFFSIIFPIIFILIFGAFGNENLPKYNLAILPNSDTSNAFYNVMKQNSLLNVKYYKDTQNLATDMAKGKITAALQLFKISNSENKIKIHTVTTSANANTFGGFMHELDYMRLRFENTSNIQVQNSINIDAPEIRELRPYRPIDFILPGQLGFSILFATLFGIAFTFYNLREQLVLKRFYASPVNKISILAGIGISRLFFQLLNVIILIAFGHFFLHFTLVHGFTTFLEMVLLSIIMLILLMGIGLIVSSIAKSDTNIPLLINLFGFPQMLLSGTFFPVEVFPKWLQNICQALPLTQFNDAMRKISFEGLHLWNCGKQIGIISIWIFLVYVILNRIIKWE